MNALQQLLAADELAEECHLNQMYGNVPYQYHLKQVEEKFKELFGVSIKGQTVCILHDILEDTKATVDTLKDFDQEIVEAVVAITKLDNETRKEYLSRVKQNELAKKVKIADTASNLEHSLKDQDARRIIKYSEQLTYLYK